MALPILSILDPAGTSALGLLTKKLEGRNIPWEVLFEITQKCNLRCTHCYNFDRTTDNRPPQLSQELSSAEIIRVIDEVIEAGCWNLGFSGGEALVHPDIFKFIEHARAHSLQVTVKTNGVLLTPERVKRMADLGVHRVWVSIYGADSETHDYVTAVQSSFEKSIKGCEEVAEAGMMLTIASVLTRKNVKQVGQIKALAERLNANFVMTPEVTVRHDGTDSSRAHIPNREDTRETFSDHHDFFVGRADFNPERLLQCACAQQKCAITATGDVYPCINAPLKAGNVRDTNFQEIWDHSPLFERIRAIRHTDFKDCQGCEDKPWCHRSSGTVYTNTGDYLGADPVTCSQAQVRREVWEDKNGKVNLQEKHQEYLAERPIEDGQVDEPIECPAV
jgi:radical SAM protein with 4Fe4S-binding SPASM domain